MSQEETLYIKIDQNILVHDYHVTLGDIAKLESSDKSMVRQLKQKKIYSFEKPNGNLKNKKQIQVISIMKVIAWIHEEYPNVDIQNMGEPDFVLEYEPKKEENKVWDCTKTVLLTILVFFGAAFTIMAFNNDVSIDDAFEKFYLQVMGTESNGMTELEVSYCIGLPVGILVFFNHFGKGCGYDLYRGSGKGWAQSGCGLGMLFWDCSVFPRALRSLREHSRLSL